MRALGDVGARGMRHGARRAGTSFRVPDSADASPVPSAARLAPDQAR